MEKTYFIKILKSSLLAIATLFVTLSVQAQTADGIINKYFDAIGGKDVIGKIKSRYMESEISVKNAVIPVVTNDIFGKGHKIERDFKGKKFIQCITNNGGWTIDPRKGSTVQLMSSEDYNSHKGDLHIGGKLINYAADGCKLALAGKETLDNMSVYKVVLTDTDNNETDFYFDAATYYLVKIIRGGENAITIRLSNYQKTDIGYVMPFTSVRFMPKDRVITTTVKKVVINQDIDPKIFDKPE